MSWSAVLYGTVRSGAVCCPGLKEQGVLFSSTFVACGLLVIDVHVYYKQPVVEASRAMRGG